LRKTLIISLLGFNYFTNEKRYFRCCCYKDFETGELYPELDFADLYFVELKKFDKELKHVITMLDRWITFLNKVPEHDKDKLSTKLQEAEIIQTINTIETLSFNAKERKYYEREKKVMIGRYAVIQTAVANATHQTKIATAIEIAKGLNADFKMSDNLFCISIYY